MKLYKSLFTVVIFFVLIMNISALSLDEVENKDELIDKIVEKYKKKQKTVKIDTPSEMYNELYNEYLKLSDEEKQSLKYAPTYKYKTYSYNNELLLRSSNFNDILIRSSNLAETYDLRDYGFAPQMRNQGPFGLCWAFSFNSMLESYLIRKGFQGAETFNFSELASDLQQESLYDNEIVIGNYDEYDTGRSDLYSYKNAFGVQSLSNVLLNWTYFNPVLEGVFGTSKENSLLKGKDYTYQNIANYYIEELNKNGREIADYNLEELLNELPINEVLTKNSNFPFNVSAKQLISYINNNLLVEEVNLTTSLVQSVKEQVNKVKEYIMENGAAASMTIVPKDFNTNTQNHFVHNNFSRSNLKNYVADKEGHAYVIIGWDDNYGDIDGDSKGDGAWLAQNSWGENSNNDYFYVSYYDVFTLQGIFGIDSVEENKSDNIYNFSSPEVKFEDIKQDAIYYNKYFLGNNKEEIDSLKLYLKSTQEKNVTVTISDENNECTSNALNKNGTVLLKFNNCILSGKVDIKIKTKNKITNENLFDVEDEIHTVLYTKNNTAQQPLEIKLNENESTMLYKNYLANGDILYLFYDNTITEEYDESLVKLEITNQNNEEITDYIILLNLNSFIINNSEVKRSVLFLDRLPNTTEKLIIKTYYDKTLVHKDEFDIINLEIDTNSEMIKIKNPIDIIAFNGTHFISSFYLENDIDLTSLQQPGEIFEDGINFNTSELNLYGNGHSISGINNNKGGLFNTLVGSNLQHIEFSNITGTSNNYGGIIANEASYSNIDGVKISNSSITSDISGGIFGKNIDSNISNVLLDNISINGTSSSGALNGLIYHDYYIEGYYYNQQIKNIFINDVSLNSPNKSIISSKGIIIDDPSSGIVHENELKVENVVNLGLENTDYFNDFKAYSYNGISYISLSNPNIHHKVSNSMSINDNDLNNIEEIFNPKDKKWVIENGKIPEIIIFRDGYSYTPLIQKLTQYGKVYMNDYLIIDPINNINEFINKEDIIIEFPNIQSSEYSTKNNINYEEVKISDELYSENYYIIIRGDTNSDGKADILDFKKISNYLISNNPNDVIKNYYERYSADVNFDGVIDILDFKRISNYLLTNEF